MLPLNNPAALKWWRRRVHCPEDARTGEDECCQNPPADHDLIAMRGRDSLLSAQSGVKVPEDQKLPEIVQSSAETFARANGWKTYAG
jgi:hypothetical protein